MEEFWLVSAPGEPTPKKMWDHVREKTKELSASHKFGLPDLQVCPLREESVSGLSPQGGEC